MRYTLLIFIFSLIGFSSSAQIEVKSTKTQSVIKASYIYNFAKHCKWDDAYYQQSYFKIAVYGDRDLYVELLDKYGTRPINDQSIEVIWIQAPEELNDEQIIFVGSSKKSEISKLAAIAEENKSLLITDFSSGLESGGIINFTVVNNTLAFDVNKGQALKNAIQLGTRIINWANKIKD